jgi:hypothetical protein
MSYKDNQFIIAQDLSFVGVLQDIKKSKTALSPIFECFTNALEAIKIKQNAAKTHKGEIVIKINASETTVQSTELNSISIIDNGIGFNNEEFKRFNTFKLTNKGFKNLGSGRIQYVHYFDTTTIKSVFEQDGNFFEREFVVSKREDFLKQNAIVKHRICKETSDITTGTTVVFSTLLENSGIYNDLNENTLKEKILERYIHHFCYNKTKLPKIKIEFYVQSVFVGESTISEIDIPSIDKSKKIPLQYSLKSNTGIEKIEKTEDFTIDAFKVSKNLLKENKLNLVSKGEVIEESDVTLQSLAGSDIVKGNKYLFLVSSNYIDARDTNLRGVLNIPTKEAFEKDLFANQEEILVEDIQEELNNSINTMYPEIEEVKQKHQEDFAKLKEMFLLDDETAKDISVSINDSETDILKKFYEAEAKKSASLDAKIKESFDSLEKLDTTSDGYSEQLEMEIQKLVRVIPLQNKVSLTQYVARRKLVLDLFHLINNRKLSTQINADRNKDEKLLHNLIFQQTNSTSEDSDLWLINEDFIYFKGASEKLLKDVEHNGVKLLRENLTEEEEEFRTALNENRYAKRPDILLFPEEGKCLIIEFKNPDVNVSDHLNQINNYASLIWNFSNPQFKFEIFYGYLIGEKINTNDVRFHDGDFKEAYQFDYLFRPNKLIPGLYVKGDASLYTEVIKYSTLYDRAKRRNDIFLKKLGKTK